MAEPPFPDALTRFRELNGISQKQLARRVNASAAPDSRWTNGHALPRPPMAEMLDAELGASGKLLATQDREAGHLTFDRAEWAALVHAAAR
ncbi:helix-turn-helix domain-containing protein [Nocardiopsis quinghaiensis]|uniref:helix-turn-helix domain-containing protein n=1 Tax=Nocardiopsis quinghaiensis TaxID=464995 RepID=UPI0012387470|nr:helix-turn-helix domain-containing protein [Nocardiopsis quinghaiensis]